MLFLCSGDLRNALVTAVGSSKECNKLNLHLSDTCSVTVARNIVSAHVINSDSFDANDSDDLHYLWSIWYSFKWNEPIRSRFVIDLTDLIALDWKTASHIVLDDVGVYMMKRIFHSLDKTGSQYFTFSYCLCFQRQVYINFNFCLLLVFYFSFLSRIEFLLDVEEVQDEINGLENLSIVSATLSDVKSKMHSSLKGLPLKERWFKMAFNSHQQQNFIVRPEFGAE